MNFPCPLSSHNHEMNTCRDFFSINPEERWKHIRKGRICYTCLRPKTVCKEKTCMFTSTLPEVLLCQGCGEYAKTQGWAPFNILMCRKPQHAETRAPVSEIRTQLEKYVGKLDHAIDSYLRGQPWSCPRSMKESLLVLSHLRCDRRFKFDQFLQVMPICY